MVLFITGKCFRYCFYCPISNLRRGSDTVYANEKRVQCDDDVLDEARSMDALGTGITGGEPLLRLDRVIYYINLLKGAFGKDHHIHLYTSIAPNYAVLKRLSNAGLDEIRFHPPLQLWDYISTTRYCAALVKAKAVGLDIGIEIPALKPVPEIIRILAEAGGFLNLNELEFSETNYDQMILAGFTPSGQGYAALESSAMAHSARSSIVPVYFCSSGSKDSVQLRERLKRKAKNIARPFDEITADGTLVYGVIEQIDDWSLLKGFKQDEYEVTNNRLETAWWIAEYVAEHNRPPKKYAVKIVERYPEGQIVETTPL